MCVPYREEEDRERERQPGASAPHHHHHPQRPSQRRHRHPPVLGQLRGGGFSFPFGAASTSGLTVATASEANAGAPSASSPLLAGQGDPKRGSTFFSTMSRHHYQCHSQSIEMDTYDTEASYLTWLAGSFSPV
ncbi:hypothetical protein pipiens_007854 [Culex pipiens pipiens]|uniref:Uncharacterized protein n=1 Tax=Culex pipiens pipiens TaxID=38569 RepID=A0ABD1DK42_CULPP